MFLVRNRANKNVNFMQNKSVFHKNTQNDIKVKMSIKNSVNKGTKDY